MKDGQELTIEMTIQGVTYSSVLIPDPHGSFKRTINGVHARPPSSLSLRWKDDPVHYFETQFWKLLCCFLDSLPHLVDYVVEYLI